MPNAQCPIPNSQCPIPNSQFPIPNAQFPMPNAQCPMPNAQCPMPNAKREDVGNLQTNDGLAEAKGVSCDGWESLDVWSQSKRSGDGALQTGRGRSPVSVDVDDNG